MIKACIFDFGRVISAQKRPALFRSYENELGLKVDTINAIMFDSPHWQAALAGEISMDQYWQNIGPQLNLHSATDIVAFQQRYYADESINESVVELLKSLHGRYRLTILSNHPAGLREWLAEWRITDLFELVICSGEVGLVKPDPRIYHLLLERLQLTPAKTVFIDDTPGHVEAAQDLGIKGLVFTDAPNLHRQLAPILGEDS